MREMREIDIERMKRYGLNPKDFEPSAEQPTIEDVVEALNILTTIILGEYEND